MKTSSQKPVSFRLSEEEAEFLKEEVDKSGLTITDYIKHCVFSEKQVITIEGGREIASAIHKLQLVIEKDGSYSALSQIKQEVEKICQSLNALTAKIPV